MIMMRVIMIVRMPIPVRMTGVVRHGKLPRRGGSTERGL
jgi:hypothetical protein